jgi:hypothetical protein
MYNIKPMGCFVLVSSLFLFSHAVVGEVRYCKYTEKYLGLLE